MTFEEYWAECEAKDGAAMNQPLRLAMRDFAKTVWTAATEAEQERQKTSQSELERTYRQTFGDVEAYAVKAHIDFLQGRVEQLEKQQADVRAFVRGPTI